MNHVTAFVNSAAWDYTPAEGGPLHDTGVVIAGNDYDITGSTPRTVGVAPDRGAVERYAGCVALSWTDPTDPDLAGIAIYRSPDVDEPIDLSAVYATVAPGAETWTEYLVSMTGRLQYLARAFDAAKTEANIGQLVVVDMVDGAQVLRPNSPVSASAAWDGTAAHATVLYDHTGEAGAATEIRVYADDGLGGAVSYAADVGSAALPGADSLEEVEIDLAGLVAARAYQLVARAATAAGVEDPNTDAFTCDTSSPGASPDLDLEVI